MRIYFLASFLVILLLNSFYIINADEFEPPDSFYLQFIIRSIENNFNNSSIQNNLGIFLDDKLYHNGDIISFPFGKHYLKAYLKAPYVFLRWYAGMGIEIMNETSPETWALFTGDVPVPAVIGIKMVLKLYMYVGKNDSNTNINNEIQIMNYNNNEVNNKFLPAETIKIKVSLPFKINVDNYKIINGYYQFTNYIYTNNSIMKREGINIIKLDKLSWNSSGSIYDIINNQSITHTYPDGNYELGMTNNTGKYNIISKSQLDIILYTNDGKIIKLRFENTTSILINVAGITVKVIDVMDGNDSYIINFSLLWNDDLNPVRGKKGVIALNIKEIKLSSPYCDDYGLISTKLNKSITSLFKGLNGSLEIIPQLLGNIPIENSQSTKINWSKLGTIVTYFDNKTLILKIIKLKDFTAVANALVVLFINNTLYDKAYTNSSGFVKFTLNNLASYYIIQVTVIVNRADEILLSSDFSDIIIYYKLFT
jgi:hypothetical protein